MSDVMEKVCKAVLELIKHEDVTFEKLKISDIAKRANIGKGTVYEYFKSKEQVITESLLYVLREFGEVFDSEPGIEGANFHERLIEIIKKIFYFLEDNKKLSYMFFTGSANITFSSDMKVIMMTEMTKIRDKVNKFFSVLFENGKKEGILSGDLNSISKIIAEQAILSSITYYYHNMSHTINNTNEFFEGIYNAVVKILS